ncbi:sigma factor binding protein 1, chloroplastic-like [Rhododendron vialii]|uniref:sigma factor binding protein 1, chloroplastic-like n=1 Tax=Rhododendron vialii TaxID=182163 RepID=UPI00265DE84D|nr:sigma factor binding protein 1, chloroplastic-like [Rhododendron vialii]
MEPPRSVHDMKNSRKRKGRRESVKVVYISSPVKVKTSASRFRALVQELTGRDSDVSRYVEANNGSYYHDDHSQGGVVDRGISNSVSDRVSDSTTSSDSYLELEPSFDDLLMNSNGQGGFLGMFPSSNLICDQGFEFKYGILGEYGAV